MDKDKSDFLMVWNTHPKHCLKRWCYMMEQRILVDVEIFCGSKIMYVHKCMLAANSNYFKEEFDRSPTVKQIILSGLDFAVVKAIVEFIYCGETQLRHDNVKYVVAASRLLQIAGIDLMFSDHEDYHLADDIYIPHPQFIRGGPKYMRECNAPNIFCRGAAEPERTATAAAAPKKHVESPVMETAAPKIVKPMQVIDFIEKQKRNVFDLIKIPTANDEDKTMDKSEELKNPDLLTEIMETTKIFMRDQELDVATGKFPFSVVEPPEINNEKKPIQFMLVDNVVFSDGTLGSNGGIKICAETKFPTVVTNNEDGAAVKETLEFSPDIFFADPISCKSQSSNYDEN